MVSSVTHKRCVSRHPKWVHEIKLPAVIVRTIRLQKDATLKDLAEAAEQAVKDASDEAEKAGTDLETATKAYNDKAEELAKQPADTTEQASDRASQMKTVSDNKNTAVAAKTAADEKLAKAKQFEEAVNEAKQAKISRTAWTNLLKQGVALGAPGVVQAGMSLSGSTNALNSSQLGGSVPQGFASFNYFQYKDPVQAADCATQVSHVGFAIEEHMCEGAVCNMDG